MNHKLRFVIPMLVFSWGLTAEGRVLFDGARVGNTEARQAASTAAPSVVLTDSATGIVSTAEARSSEVVSYDLANTPKPATALFVATSVLVGFILRCRRKGLPFRSSTTKS